MNVDDKTYFSDEAIELRSIRQNLLGTRVLVKCLPRQMILVKANFDRNQPRVPPGNGRSSGRWSDDGLSVDIPGRPPEGPSAEEGTPSGNPKTAPKSPRLRLPEPEPGIGHNGGPPLEDPPIIPAEEPAMPSVRTMIAKGVARWALRALLRSELGPLGLAIDAAEAAIWTHAYYPEIESYFDSPKSLDELRRLAREPAPGYEIHHIVEETSALADGFPNSMVNGPENLVRVPKWRHHEITAWSQRRQERLGGLSPRQYLKGKSWDERMKIGLEGLRQSGGSIAMTISNLKTSDLDTLVDRFISIGVEQDEAELREDIPLFNRLYDQKIKIVAELKSRHGDQRRALLGLYEHFNMQVRLNAAIATLAVAPIAARSLLQDIQRSPYPQRLDAGMTIVSLDEGSYVPD